MGGGLESRCVGRVYGGDGAVHLLHQVGISHYFNWYLLFFLDDCLLSWLDWNRFQSIIRRYNHMYTTTGTYYSF